VFRKSFLSALFASTKYTTRYRTSEENIQEEESNSVIREDNQEEKEKDFLSSPEEASRREFLFLQRHKSYFLLVFGENI